MVFNSITFAVFLLVVLVVYWRVPGTVRNAVLLMASYVFYGWWDWRFLGLIALSTVVDFVVARRVHTAQSERGRKGWLFASLGVNLGVLGVFKYADFFVASAADALSALGVDASGPTLGLVLPVGISFYTFQTISYTFDVYRGRIEPAAGFVDFATYVAYFPQLVAGPIERAQRLLPRIIESEQRHFPRGRDLDRALSLIASGMFKKIVLADGVAPFVNEIFSDPSAHSGIAVAAGVVGFAIQLYGDFSGYTDIARGVSELFGIDLMVNFRQPYLSRNITEFWRRWHISLSDWLRDYLYIPLGGNRNGTVATIRNLMITMLLGGLWHGASWNFVIWGAMHGLALAVHRVVRRARTTDDPVAVMHIPAIVATFSMWCLSMVFFRAVSFGDAVDVLQSLAAPLSGSTPWPGIFTVLVLVAATLGVDLAQRRIDDRESGPDAPHDGSAVASSASPIMSGALAGLVVVSIVVFSGGSPSPFIYFQF